MIDILRKNICQISSKKDIVSTIKMERTNKKMRKKMSKIFGINER